MQDYRGPFRRETDPLLSELIKRMDRHEDNQERRHTENIGNFDEVKGSLAELAQTVGMNTYRMGVMETWRKDEADPAIERVNEARWMVRGAVTVGGLGGMAGIAAAIKAFFFGVIH